MTINETLLYSYIGNRIRERRRALKRTQLWLADQLAVERTSISNIEAGMQRVPLHVLYRCCDALDLEITDLVPLKATVGQTNAPSESPNISIRFDGRTVPLPPKAASLVRSIRKEMGGET